MRTAIGAGYLAIYLAAAWAALPHALEGLPILPWNAAPAISFGLVVRFGWRWLPVTVAAPMLASGLDGLFWTDLAETPIQAAAEGMACALAASFVGWRQGRPGLDRLRGVFVFFGAATIFAVTMASARGLANLVLTVVDPWESLALSGLAFLAQLVAALAVAPLIVACRRPGRWPRGRVLSSVEGILQAVALAVISWEVFGRFVNEEVHFFYLLFLPFTWIATRHGQPGSVLALAAMYLAPVASDRMFGHHDHAIVELQIRLGVLAVTSLLLGAMVSERRLSEARMLTRQAELAHFQRLNVGWEMASALAHELNQPLTSAMNYTQAALRLITAPSPDLAAAGRVMAKSVDQIERVGQTIHGLRDFMRKGELRLAVNDIEDIVEEAIRLVLAEANAAGITLRSIGLTALPPVMVDKTQIVQVLVNLVRNAVQALAATDEKNGVVVVSGRVAEGAVDIAVGDNGPGLHPDVVVRMFEPFVTTKDAGMGLGLSISKSILEAHDGRLWAEPAPPAGTVFHFTLPLATKGEADA